MTAGIYFKKLMCLPYSSNIIHRIYKCKGDKNPKQILRIKKAEVGIMKKLLGIATACMMIAAIGAVPVFAADAPVNMAGGWMAPAENNSYLTKEQEDIFAKAMEGHLGVDIKPIALLGTQVVAGMNYAFLCEKTPVTPNAETGLAVVTIYADLQGNAQITKIKDINLADLLADNAEEADYSDYIGYQFAGKDPWGGELTVTLRTLEDGQLTWTYTDLITNELMVYTEVGPTEFKDGKGEFEIKGKIMDDPGDSVFNYAGTIELADGNVVIKLTDGAVISANGEGGAAYQVGPLDEAAREITLVKTTDGM